MGAVSNDMVRQALVEFVSRHISICFVGEVTDNAQAESDGLVTVTYNEMDFTVRLQAVSGQADKGHLSVPAVGSQVFCVSEGNSDNAFVASTYTVVEKFAWKVGNKSIILSADGIILNGGELGGLVKLQELTDNLNSLKSYIEAINSALPSAFNAVGASTAANGVLGAQSYQGAMAGKSIEIKDMENPNIKQ